MQQLTFSISRNTFAEVKLKIIGTKITTIFWLSSKYFNHIVTRKFEHQNHVTLSKVLF